MPNLKLGAILPYADEVIFLGIIFDSKLTWTKHNDDLKLRVKKSHNILSDLWFRLGCRQKIFASHI